ncbi:hypothetical protein Q2490_07655 [Myroides odoratimimus]|uniref:hypothetical protein n=1 Tax=Myroides odoratimimus TaxID=76832 RepID=UPI0026DF3440|nr:hypothetical protein [Myroides odoratimimus]MDO5857158.1 hypothetical protein [Myroides odoratimimus]
MKKNIITLLAVVLSASAFAQTPVKPGVGIGIKKVSTSAALQVESDKKGVLIPRVDLKALVAADATNHYGLLGNPEQGIAVYNKIASTDYPEGFYYWDAGAKKWEAITSSSKLETVIKDTKETLQKEITEKITEITKIPGNPGDPTDLSYMVAFKPEPLKPGDPIPAKSKGVLQYLVPHEEKDGDGKVTKITYTKHEIGFDELVSGAQTVTDINRFVGDGTKIEAKDIKVDLEDPKNKVKGKIFYTYTNEDKVTQFIDVTSDFLETIKENKEIRKEIVSVITEVGTGGDGDGGVKPIDPTDPDKSKAWGNVYYGPENGKDGPAVLYSIDKDGNKHYIDISKNIINEITNNNELIEKIKETVRVEVGKTPDSDVPTGEVIGGKRVFKGLTSISVNGDATKGEYDSEPKANITIHPTKVTIGADGVAKVEQDATVKFGRLINVTVLAKGGSVLVSSATDVERIGGDTFKFSFGTGSLYTPILGGDYDLVFEYTEL